MTNKLTIRARLIAVIAFLSAQLIVVGAVGIAGLHHANGTIRSMYDDRLVAVGRLDRIIRLIEQNESTIARALIGEKDEVEQSLREVSARLALVETEGESYLALPLSPAERKLADEFSGMYEKYLAEGLFPAVEALKQFDPNAATAAVHGKMAPLVEPLRRKMDAVISLQLSLAEQEYAQSQASYEWLRNGALASLALGLALAIVVGRWLVIAITRPLDAAVNIASAVAEGDLTQRIVPASDDEAGKLMQALKNMNESLRAIVGQVRSGTEAVVSAATQVAAGNLDLSARTERQASSLQETASTLEVLTGTVRGNADNAEEANRLARLASGVAEEGRTAVERVVGTMQSIEAASSRVVEIISVIDSIAFQTNILALNAAVEAARAGEQGRGFAVVAGEVRALARRCADAAGEIKELIHASAGQVETGAKLVGDAGGRMGEIVSGIGRVSRIIGEIAAASREQTAAIGQINQVVGQLDQATQQNAALVEEAAASTESMREQAAMLERAVRRFRIEAGAVHVTF